MWNVDIPTQDQLAAIAQFRAPAVVSIYLPTTPVTADAQADRIALANLARDAVRLLQEHPGATTSGTAEIEEELADIVDDDDFWERQARGLAVFATPEQLRLFRLPRTVSAQMHVSDRAFLKPLLAVTSRPMSCFVLALSEGTVRLVEVAADLPAETIRVPDLPRSAASAAGKSSIGDRSHSGRLVGSEGKRTHIRHFARQVDSALRPVLAGGDTPLILAAVDPVRSIFRGINTYPHLVEGSIDVNPDRISNHDLGLAARVVLDDAFVADLQGLSELIELRTGQQRVLTDAPVIARAATAGAVDTLVLDTAHVMMGSVDQAGEIRPAEAESGASYGVLDEVARRVLLTRGRVLALDAAELPADVPALAVTRFPWSN